MENIEHYKKLLLGEKADLEKSLASRGKTIDGNGDWTAKPGVYDESEEDHTVQADRMDDLQNNIAAVDVLEARLAKVVAALVRIEDGTYGKCGDHEIPAERLEANPAAATCLAHVEQ